MPTKEEAMAEALGYTLKPEDGSQETQNQNTETKETEESTEEKTEESNTSEKSGETTEETKETSEETKEEKTEESTESASGDSKKVIPTETSETTSEDASSKETQTETQAQDQTQEQAFANEQVALLNEYINQGGTLEDFVRTQTVDYDKLKDFDAILEMEKIANPEMTGDELRVLLEEDYGVPENATDRQKQVALAKIKRDSQKARKALAEHKEKWAVPEVTPAETQAKNEAAQEAWTKQLNTATDNVAKIDIQINENESFSYEVPKETNEQIKKDFSNLQNFWSRYVNEDGSENTEKFVRDMAILNNFESIVRSAASLTKAGGKEEVIKDIKNPDFEGKGKKETETGAGSIEQQAINAMFGTK
jgi:hypothetical protein